jgi:diguanylate cyclase (GGDEF)-like protein
VLRGIVEEVSASIRSSDCCARLGGDEFALLLGGMPNDALAAFVVERIRAGIAGRAFSAAAGAITASCSFGFVRVGPEQATREQLGEELLTCADAALYASKRRGKNSATAGSLRPLLTLPAAGAS